MYTIMYTNICVFQICPTHKYVINHLPTVVTEANYAILHNDIHVLLHFLFAFLTLIFYGLFENRNETHFIGYYFHICQKKFWKKHILNKRNFLRPAPITHFELSSYIFHKSLCKFFCTKLCSAISMTFLKWKLNYCDGINRPLE